MKTIIDFFKTHAVTIILIIIALVIYHKYIAKCECNGGGTSDVEIPTTEDAILDTMNNGNPGGSISSAGTK